MIKRVLAVGVLVSCLYASGCCSNGCGKGMGCGRTYLGAYADDPPGCEPCDTCANWTGKCCGGKRGISFPWDRTGLFGALCGKKRGCCDEISCEATCGEVSCEATCGEPTCGTQQASCGCGQSHGAMMEAAVSPPWRSGRVRQVGYSTGMTQSQSTGGCNCKH